MRQLTASPNTARGWARELPEPASWTDPIAKRVYDALSVGIVDLYLIECDAQPVSDDEARAYPGAVNVIAYRLWDAPGPSEDAQRYLVRHIAKARQQLGGKPYFHQ